MFEFGSGMSRNAPLIPTPIIIMNLLLYLDLFSVLTSIVHREVNFKSL
jgi:hypothetical protein